MLAIRDASASEAIFAGMERQRSADLELRQEFDRYVADSKRLIEALQKENETLKLQAETREGAILAERQVSNATIANLRTHLAYQSGIAEQRRISLVNYTNEVARLNARIAEAKKSYIPGIHFAAYIALGEL